LAAEKTNLAELHEPFLQMVKDMSVAGQQTARVMYNARGWVAHHNTDIWRATGAIDGANWGYGMHPVDGRVSIFGSIIYIVVIKIFLLQSILF
jgi:hypothetical protein